MKSEIEKDNAEKCAGQKNYGEAEGEQARGITEGFSSEHNTERAGGNFPKTVPFENPATQSGGGETGDKSINAGVPDKTSALNLSEEIRDSHETRPESRADSEQSDGSRSTQADLSSGANTVRDDEHTVHIKTKHKVLRRNYDYYPIGIKRFFFRIAWWIVIPLLVLYDWIFLGMRFMDKKNASYFRFGKHKKLITVSNHLHIMDCSMVAHIFYPRKIYFTSIQSNFGIPVAGGLVRLLGGVPIPDDKENMRKFTDDMEKMMRANRIVQYYPESALHPYQANIRSFKKGAFQFAVQSQAPVLPIVFLMRKPKGLYRLYKRRPLFTGIVGKPLYPNPELEGKEAVVELMNRVREEMTELQKRGLKRLGEKRTADVYRSMGLFEKKD